MRDLVFTETVEFRCTAQQDAAWRAAAHARRTSLSEWLRGLAEAELKRLREVAEAEEADRARVAAGVAERERVAAVMRGERV